MDNTINKYRIKKKLSARDLASKMNVSYQTVYNWINGLEPSVEQMVQLGRLLGVSSVTIFKDYSRKY